MAQYFFVIPGYGVERRNANDTYASIFAQLSVAREDFFKSDFGSDFMDIDKIRRQMIARQKKFLEKY